MDGSVPRQRPDNALHGHAVRLCGDVHIMERAAVIHIGHVSGIAHGDILRVGGAPGHLARPAGGGELGGELGAAAHAQGNIGNLHPIGIFQHNGGQGGHDRVGLYSGRHRVCGDGGLARARGGINLRPLAHGGQGRGFLRLGLLLAVELRVDKREYDDQRRHDDDQRAQEGDEPGPVDGGQVEAAALLGGQPLAALGPGGVILLLRRIVKGVLPAEDEAVVRLLFLPAPGGGRRRFAADGGAPGVVALSTEGAAPVGGAVILAAGGAVDQGVAGRLGRHIGIPPWTGNSKLVGYYIFYTFSARSSILLLCNPAVFCPCGPG